MRLLVDGVAVERLVEEGEVLQLDVLLLLLPAIGSLLRQQRRAEEAGEQTTATRLRMQWLRKAFGATLTSPSSPADGETCHFVDPAAERLAPLLSRLVNYERTRRRRAHGPRDHAGAAGATRSREENGAGGAGRRQQGQGHHLRVPRCLRRGCRLAGRRVSVAAHGDAARTDPHGRRAGVARPARARIAKPARLRRCARSDGQLLRSDDGGSSRSVRRAASRAGDLGSRPRRSLRRDHGGAGRRVGRDRHRARAHRAARRHGAAIAAEKAPVVRPGGLGFTAATGLALAVLERHASSVGARLSVFDRDFGFAAAGWNGLEFAAGCGCGRQRAAGALAGRAVYELPALALAAAVFRTLLPGAPLRLDPAPRPLLPCRFEILPAADAPRWCSTARTPRTRSPRWQWNCSGAGRADRSPCCSFCNRQALA